jgi:arginyl-tRNA synthetase
MIKTIKELEKFLSEKLNAFDVNQELVANFSNIENVDIQFNQLIALKNHGSFNEISNSMLKTLNELEIIEKCELTQQGFININLSDKFFHLNISNNKEELLNKLKNQSGKIVLDYGGANIGKSLHVGHLRTLTIGRSLKNIYRMSGYDVISDIHFGDWGMPIGLILALIEEKNIDINTLTSSDLEIIYPEAALLAKDNESFKEKAQEYSKKLNENNKDAIKQWKVVYELSTENLISFLNKINFEFDLYKGESDVVKLIPGLINSLKENNLVKLDQGALVANNNDNPPSIIVKSDGSYIYLTTDLATVLDREEKISPDKYIYIVDQRQHQHFDQLFKLVKLFSLSEAEFQHVGFGTINDKNGKPLKTRDGGNYKLEDLYKDINNLLESKNSDENLTTLSQSVLTYSDLVNSRLKNYNFDIEKFTNINGKSAVYIQYSNVRAKKLISQFDGKLKLDEILSAHKKILIELIKLEYYFGLALKNNEPHHLAEYMYKLCQEFNTFYNSEKIFSENKNKNQISNDLFLVSCFIQHIEIISECLGIQLVEEM